MEVGICPQCLNMVVEIRKRDYNGTWSSEIAKRKKAQRLFNENKQYIIGDYQKSIKSGNRSNMGFRFGENVEVKNGKEKIIRQYAIDFNGTKELVKSLK